MPRTPNNHLNWRSTGHHLFWTGRLSWIELYTTGMFNCHIFTRQMRSAVYMKNLKLLIRIIKSLSSTHLPVSVPTCWPTWKTSIFTTHHLTVSDSWVRVGQIWKALLWCVATCSLTYLGSLSSLLWSTFLSPTIASEKYRISCTTRVCDV